MLGFTTLRRWLGYGPPAKESAKAGASEPAARLDNSRTGHENANHWAAADSLGPNATYNPADRRTVRDRARYEVANNSFAFGVVTSRSHDLIGTGPRLSVTLPDDDGDRAAREDAARKVEAEFSKWSAAVDLAGTLRLLNRSMLVDGESFALRTTDESVRHPVKLRLRPFECDRVCDPELFGSSDPLNVDGVRFDAAGNVVSYTVLRRHPGEPGYHAGREHDTVRAADVYHFFRADRPGQARGVSWLNPALGLFAQLRRYTLAVLASAETAANIAAVLETQLPPSQDEPTPVKAMSEFELPRNSAVALPGGAKLTQLKAEQPTQQFGDFRAQICLEVGRSLDLPLNYVTGNSSGYNFSSGRLDHLPFHRKLWTERDQLAVTHLARLFRDWLDEAALAGVVPAGLPPLDTWVVEWHWDSPGDIDPIKEATAYEKLLALNVTTLAEVCAGRGQRWQDVLRQRKREQDFADQIGLRTAAAAPAPVPAGGRGGDEDEDEEEAREE